MLLFFDSLNRYIISLYTNVCLDNIGGLIFESKIGWSVAKIYQPKVFWVIVNGNIKIFFSESGWLELIWIINSIDCISPRLGLI